MVEVLHQSTVVHPTKQVESKETLVPSLDDLLERYLRLLDQYQTLQQSLAQLFSKVRIDLAEFCVLVLNLPRVIYHLLEPTFQIRIVYATARINTMIECRHPFVCTSPVSWYRGV